VCRGPLRLLPLLSLLSFSVGGCASSSAFPLWLDSIQRLPIKSVTVGGHRVAYLDSGQGPPVILVHGLGGSLWNWEYQQAALSASHRLLTLDLLGSGLSDKPDIDYTPQALLEFFRGFMDAVGVDRAALVGNSLGAGLVLGMALAHPERVDRLVLIGGLPAHVRENTASPLIRRTIDSTLPAWLVSLGNRFTGRGTTRLILEEIVYDPTLLTPAVIDRSYRNRSRPGLIWPLLSLARNLPVWEDTFAKRLSEIRQPTLVLWGAEDRVFPPEVGRELHRTIPGSAFELVPKAGHIPQWEQPDVVNSLLVRFLQP
jgi:pimeloyl-ACP methyl ester carboxylesterase